MPTTLDFPTLLLAILLVSVCVGSLALWLARWLAPRNLIQTQEPIPTWAIGWINFGIFICALVVGVFVLQTYGFKFLSALDVISVPTFEDSSVPLDSDLNSDAELESSETAAAEIEITPELALTSILLLHVPILLIILGLRRFYPSQFAGRYESNPLPWLKAMKRAVPNFLRYLPLIWIAGIIWNIILGILISVGVIDKAPPQELIEIFGMGGSPYVIGSLALSAILLAPYVEEILFRGCIYRFFKTQTLLPFAQFISGVIFAAIHGNLASFGPLIVVGILLAHTYEREGSLRVSICFHAFFNAFSLTMIYLASQSEVVPLP